MTALGIILLAGGVVGVVLGLWLVFTDRTSDAGFILVVLCLAAGIVGAAVMQSIEDDACTAKGGHQVPDGPPIYVKSGNVIVPVQGYRCEVAR